MQGNEAITKICGNGISAARVLAVSTLEAAHQATCALQGFAIANLQKGSACCWPDSPFPYTSVRHKWHHEHPEGPCVSQQNGAIHLHLQCLQETAPFCSSMYWRKYVAGCLSHFFKSRRTHALQQFASFCIAWS